MKQKIYIATVCLALIPFGTQATHASTIENAPVSLLICPADAVTFTSKRRMLLKKKYSVLCAN